MLRCSRRAFAITDASPQRSPILTRRVSQNTCFSSRTRQRRRVAPALNLKVAVRHQLKERLPRLLPYLLHLLGVLHQLQERATCSKLPQLLRAEVARVVQVLAVELVLVRPVSKGRMMETVDR